MTRRSLLFAACVATIVLATVSTSSAHDITQACTVGFYKNHPEFITGGQCFSMNQNTLVKAIFPGVDPCIGNLTILQLLQSPTSVCGPGSTLAGAEVILLRQAITRILNGVHSFDACFAVAAVITTTNTAIATAVATNNGSGLKSLAATFDALNNAGACTVGK
jgi:hypothetical protein